MPNKIIMDLTSKIDAVRYMLALNGPFNFRLFTNDWVESSTFVVADFDEPADSGYLAPAREWDFGVVDGDDAVSPCDICTYTFTLSAGAFYIRGYYGYGQDSARAVIAHKLAVPYLIDTAGQEYQVLPRYRLKDIP